MKWIISTNNVDQTGRLFRNRCEAEEYRFHLLKNRKINGFCTDKLEKSLILPVNISNRFDPSFAFNEDVRRTKPVSSMKVYNHAMLQRKDKWDRTIHKRDFLKYLEWKKKK